MARSGFPNWLGLAALWALTAAAGPGAAQPQEAPEELFIVSIAADPARCHLGRAQRMTIAAIVRDYRSIQGRCVAVTGYWTGAGLFVRGGDARAADAHYADRFATRRLGVYGESELMRSRPRRGGRPVIAVGTVHSCESLWARGTTVMGYCHSHEAGPILALAGIEGRR